MVCVHKSNKYICTFSSDAPVTNSTTAGVTTTSTTTLPSTSTAAFSSGLSALNAAAARLQSQAGVLGASWPTNTNELLARHHQLYQAAAANLHVSSVVKTAFKQFSSSRLALPLVAQAPLQQQPVAVMPLVCSYKRNYKRRIVGRTRRCFRLRRSYA